MASDIATVMNTLTGKSGEIRRRLLDHPVFGKNLVEVPSGTKSYIDGMYRPRTPEEFIADHPEKVVLPVVEATEDFPTDEEDND